MLCWFLTYAYILPEESEESNISQVQDTSVSEFPGQNAIVASLKSTKPRQLPV